MYRICRSTLFFCLDVYVCVFSLILIVGNENENEHFATLLMLYENEETSSLEI